MNDKSIMPFGKYKGVALANVPDSYLRWIYQGGKIFGELKTYIEEYVPNVKVNPDDYKKEML